MNAMVQLQLIPDDALSARFEDVTPDTAQQYLNALAPYQRTLNARHVAQLEADMRAGRYKPNGSPIRFDVNGELCDGQHRLTAAVLAGFTLRRCLVVRGVSLEANATIDVTAAPRNARQVVRTRNKFHVAPNASMLAAVALEHYDFDGWRMKDQCTSTQRAELWETLDADTQENLRKLEQMQRRRRFNSRGSLAAVLRCMRADDGALAFFTVAFTNHDDAPPVGRLLFDTLTTRYVGRSQNDHDTAWCTMRAFAAYRRSEALKLLRPPTDWPAECRTLQTIITTRPRREGGKP